ncbi:hypothetical protein F4806DRAFT_469061 [Annulohypoxylon nitens]|nr:hypothetical protein F4806DRAFT_469061 [Annulohypoxylon nitens]
MVALCMPYIRFGECFRKKDEGNPASFKRYQELMASSDRIHGTRSLDQFYYHSLSPLERLRRDENQVVTRLFLGKENGDGVPEGTNSWPYLTVDQLWLWIIDEETIITSSTHRPDGFEDPIVERMFHRLREVKQKQIGQPPPSSVEEMSRFLVLSCIDFINSLGWKDFAPNLTADKFSKEDIGSKPIKSLYADKINQAAVKEKNLFANFKKKMKTKKVESEEERRKKEISMGKNEEKPQGLPAASNEGIKKPPNTNGETLKGQEPRDSRESNYIKKLCRFVKNKLKGNPHKGNNNDEVKSWTSISEAAVLLDEVKDILDELTILKALVGQQQYVWQSLIGRDRNPEQDNARGPAYTLLEIDEMIKMTTTVQESVNEMLNLEQNGISIMEATISRKQADENARQGKILMAFTIVTVVFTPLSFLTSLFALNVTVFQRNSQGEIEYEPGWIFPIIFCVSAGIIGPLMVYASFDDARRGANVIKNLIKKLVGRQHQSSQNPDIEKGQIENSGNTTAAQSPSQSTDSEEKP